MVTIDKQSNDAPYMCDECGFHYAVQSKADECEAWCSGNSSCNIEIIKDAKENQQ